MYTTHVGKNFELDEVPLDCQDAKILRERTIGRVCTALLLTIALFLFGSATLGLIEENFAKLDKVYNVSLPIVTLLIGYLFGGRQTSE